MSIYLDMADELYTRGLDREVRNSLGRIRLKDIGFFGRRCLEIEVSEVGKFIFIHLHKGQVKKIIKALQKYLDYAEEKTK